MFEMGYGEVMKLTEQRIIDAGMAVFAEVGYERLSMRLVAERLQVHAGSLYYHVKNKATLMALMADRVARAALDEGTAALARLGPHATDTDRVTAQLLALRLTLRNHPSGARLLSASPRSLGDGALGLMERLLGLLTDGGVPVSRAVVLADVLLSYVTGFVLQEEAESATEPPSPIAMAISPSRFPLTSTAAGLYDDDEMFTRGLALLCDRMTAIGPEPVVRRGRESRRSGRGQAPRRSR